MKTFLKKFTVADALVEADLDEIGCQSLEASEVLREIVQRAFRLGVAEGLSSAECAVARSLGVAADEMENSGNPALQAVMQMSVRCHRAASEPDFDKSPRSPSPLTAYSKKRTMRAQGVQGPKFPKDSCKPSAMAH